MSWTKIDDHFWMNPKILRGGNEVAGVYARCLCYCSAYLTDGLIPEEVALTIAGHAKPLERMENVGLVQRLESGGYYIPDYGEFNPLRAEVEARREQRREAGRRGGHARSRPLNGNGSHD